MNHHHHMRIVTLYRKYCDHRQFCFDLSAAMSCTHIFFTYILPVFLAGYFLIKWKFGYWRQRGIASTRPRTPLGDLVDVGRKFHLVQKVQTVYDESKSKNRYFGMYSFGSPVLLLTDLDIVKDVMKYDGKFFVNPVVSKTGDKLNIKPLFEMLLKQSSVAIEIYQKSIKNGRLVNVFELTSRISAKTDELLFGVKHKSIRRYQNYFMLLIQLRYLTKFQRINYTYEQLDKR